MKYQSVIETKNGNDDPIVNAGRDGKNSIRLYPFEFQDCIDRGFSTQDSRLQVTKLSQTLVSPHLQQSGAALRNPLLS
jgi:hypothetical protein